LGGSQSHGVGQGGIPKNTMSIQEAVEIQEREARLRKTPFYLMVLSGFITLAALLALVWSVTSSGNVRTGRLEIGYVMLTAALFYILYVHLKSRRRIEILELEVLKLKRRMQSSD
jgi:uncharacterized paraquat-inducible protein A